MRAADVRQRLQELGIRASKRMGQHFLLDERVADRQVGMAEIREHDAVLEIGPGLGILTERLAERTDRVVAVEMSERLASGLSEALPKVQVIVGDATKVDLPPFNKVVSNLPYQISSPITFRLLAHRFDRAVLMFQKEFADRLAASVGEPGYSRLSVKVYLRGRVDGLEAVPRAAFWPRPKVDSAIVRMEPRDRPFPVRDEAVLEDVIDGAFSHRRKRIDNALLQESSRFSSIGGDFGRAVRRIPHAAIRAEALTPEQFGEVADALCEMGIVASGSRA